MQPSVPSIVPALGSIACTLCQNCGAHKSLKQVPWEGDLALLSVPFSSLYLPSLYFLHGQIQEDSCSGSLGRPEGAQE